jgi:hypothetical protein
MCAPGSQPGAGSPEWLLLVSLDCSGAPQTGLTSAGMAQMQRWLAASLVGKQAVLLRSWARPSLCIVAEQGEYMPCWKIAGRLVLNIILNRHL